MALCFYVLGAFLPSLPGWCRNAHPQIKIGAVCTVKSKAVLKPSTAAGGGRLRALGYCRHNRLAGRGHRGIDLFQHGLWRALTGQTCRQAEPPKQQRTEEVEGEALRCWRVGDGCGRREERSAQDRGEGAHARADGASKPVNGSKIVFDERIEEDGQLLDAQAHNTR